MKNFENKTETDNEEKTYSEAEVKELLSKAVEQNNTETKTEDGTEFKNNGNASKLDDLLNAAAKGSNSGIRVKSASERYCTKRSIGHHVKTGETVRNEFGREVEMPSEQNSARSGAFLKALAARAGIGEATLDEHGRNLLEDTFKYDKFCGKFGSEWKSEIDGMQVKSVLNDSLSGGAEVVPIHFDADLISFPLLHGELFPFIDLRNVSRGNNVEGASVGNPTVQWNIADGTTIALFDTSSLIAAINTTIHTVTVALEVGRDFLADSPADVGRILTENIGQRFANELDRVTADGDGVVEPEGILNASGVTVVSSDNGVTGPPTLSDYEGLLFGIGKQYRNASMRCAFLSNDTSYRRRTGVKIDTASPSVDQRPVFGMTHNDYKTLEYPHRIDNNISNSEIAFGALAKYRMYRRQGMEVRWVTEGKELALKNQVLLVVRARFGGQIVDGSAFSKITDAQS